MNHLLNFPDTEKHNRLWEYAKRYHEATEAFDRSVCTGPIVRGSIMPNTEQERRLINRNAKLWLAAITQEAVSKGFEAREVLNAIQQFQKQK